MTEEALHMECARFRILMRIPNILWSPFGGGPDLRRFSGAIGLELCTMLQVNFGEFTFRNCLKSPGDARNVALEGTGGVPFGSFWPRNTDQIRPRSVARTPFQIVSLRTSEKTPSTRLGE
jgi:hypothetical protein